MQLGSRVVGHDEDGWIERFVHNRWMQLLLAIGGLVGLAAVVLPALGGGTKDDGQTSRSEYEVLAAAPGSPEVVGADAYYVGGEILRAWSGPDGRGPSRWKSGGSVSILGVISEHNLVAPVSLDAPVGIELGLPAGAIAMKLILTEIGTTAVPLTFRFQLGTEVFSSKVTDGGSPVGVTLEIEDGVSSVRIDISAEEGPEVDAVIALSRVEVPG